MCTGAEIGLIISGVGAAASVAGAIGGSKPKPPAVQEPQKPPQAAKTPDAALVRQKNAGAAMGPGAGNATTFLTGTGGIDPASLDLGKSVLLGQ